MKHIVLTTLPVTASRLETALHNACDSGHWDGEVQLVLDKNVNQYRLELAYDENTGPCPFRRSVMTVSRDDNRWRFGCDIARDEAGFSTPCPNCGRLPCERYEKHKKEGRQWSS